MPLARRPLIAGNWKMNGLRECAGVLAGGLLAMWGKGGHPFDILLCPPATVLAAVGDMIAGSGMALGGQDCHTAEAGAHTGDVSAAMLADIGCAYVIVGHSERRADHGESDALVHDKALAARAAGLVPVICIGETETQRDAGETLAVVTRQISESVPKQLSGGEVVVAYEPVWAIGTGRTPSAGEVQEVHAAIRVHLGGHLGAGEADGVRILYGGSVKPDNATELLGLEDVDGALVGGASLKAEDFWAIAQSSG